jgi:hypothetical protein
MPSPGTGTFETNPGANTRERTSVYSSGVTGSAAGTGTETSMIRVHPPQ